MTPRADPIAAIATAPGRGAVGIVRVSGAALGALARAITGRDLTPRRAHYGPFQDAAGQAIDYGITLFFPAPHSYTGEDVLELQAHGGPVLLQLLLSRCLEAAAATDPGTGAPVLAYLRLARPGEFTERAFLNGKLDLAQAEAVADLIDASTATAARSASRSLAGVFSGAIHALRDGLIELRLLIEATLDFPEEEIDTLSAHDVRGQLSNLQHQLSSVQGQARQGALLAEGIRVVIAGQPNAGKSSLLNALAGQELAIVTPVAGTTRDALRQTLQIDGVPIHIVDTAGLRTGQAQSADPVERIGIERAWQHIEGADAVLLLHDLTRADDAAYRAGDAAIAQQLAGKLPAREPLNRFERAGAPGFGMGCGAQSAAIPGSIASICNDADRPKPGCASREELVQRFPVVPVLHVWNKSDSVTDVACEAALAFPGQNMTADDAIAISARTGAGLDALRQRLLHLAGWQGGSGEGLFLARARHVQALARASAHLAAAAAHLQTPVPMLDLIAEELRLTQNALGEITGEFGADDLLGAIFSRFCMGK